MSVEPPPVHPFVTVPLESPGEVFRMTSITTQPGRTNSSPTSSTEPPQYNENMEIHSPKSQTYQGGDIEEEKNVSQMSQYSDNKENLSPESQKKFQREDEGEREEEEGGAQQQSVVNVVHNTQPEWGTGGKDAYHPDPREFVYPVGIRREWFSELFGCLDDVPVCALVTFCPCAYLCLTFYWFREGCCVPCCCPLCFQFCVMACLRIHTRSHETIQGKMWKDCCLSLYCCQCVLCQVRREWNHVIRYRGHRIGIALIKERIF